MNPSAYLTDVLSRIPEHSINRIAELLPDQWGA
ncbi:MAG: transposase domain-containing protein [Saprospiraceae bacterium]